MSTSLNPELSGKYVQVKEKLFVYAPISTGMKERKMESISTKKDLPLFLMLWILSCVKISTFPVETDQEGFVCLKYRDESF